MSDISKSDRFFTFQKLFWTIIYDLLFLGLIFAFITFQVRVMGRDLVIGQVTSNGRSR